MSVSVSIAGENLLVRALIVDQVNIFVLIVIKGRTAD